jgi:YVTN family beta-propeller protein
MKKLLAIVLLLAADASAQTYLLVVNKSESTLALVDPATLTVVAKVATGFTPHEVATADGFAYVSNYGTGPQPGHSLSVIDLRARKGEEIELPGLARPHGILAVDGKVFFTAEGSRVVAQFDPKSRRVTWVMGTGQNTTHMVVFSPRLNKLYAANIGSDNISSILLTGAIKQVNVGKGAEGMDLSPDGSELWVATRADGNLAIVDSATDAVKQTLTVGKMPIRVKFTPDGKRVLVSDAQDNELVIYETVTRKELGRLQVPGTPVGILMQGDGKRAFVAQTQLNKIVEIDLEKMSVGRSFESGREPDGMAWAEVR